MYEAFYKLHSKPFRLTPDAAVLFPSKAHTRAMSYLLYGFDQGEGFVMITGAVGTGKTLLIQKLMADLSQRNLAMGSIASANLDGQDILPAVAAEFGLPYEGRGKEALLQGFKQHLRELHARGTRALLVVDEAQTLHVEALEMLRILSNLECDGRALLQVFLVGQNQLRSIMIGNHLEQLRQRIVASYRLDPMAGEECRQYILYRLHAAGWNHDPKLAPEVFSGVHQASRGIPRKVNLIMDRLLLYGYLEERHVLDVAALAIVLEEMRAEMIDVPADLETDAVNPPTAAGRQVAAAGRRQELAELALKCNRLLARLLGEDRRDQHSAAPASVPVEAPSALASPPRRDGSRRA